jgi:hypothetical protein
VEFERRNMNWIELYVKVMFIGMAVGVVFVVLVTVVYIILKLKE